MQASEILETLKVQIGSSLQGIDLPTGLLPEQVSSIASQSVLQNLQSQASNGNTDGIQEMFSGQETAADHPTIAGLSPELIKNLTDKLGIDSNTASSIASGILPGIMNAFNSKSGSGDFDFQNILSQFQSGGWQGLLQDFMGGDDNKQNTHVGKNSDGFLNIIKGLFRR
jgi:hypothetical protein